jgi:hypothetical protein
LAVVWAVLGIASSAIIASGPVADGVWLIVRLAIVGAAGYLTTSRRRFGLLHAAIAGVVVMLADHVLVKGVAFLVTAEFEAAFGVVVSFIMFFWVAALVGLVGGAVGKYASRTNAAI